MRRVFLTAVFLCFSAALATCAWVYAYWTHPGPLTSPRNVVIAPGASVSGVAALLSREGVLRYPFAFRALIRIGDLSSQIKAGEYQFSPGASPSEILRKLRSGDVLRRFVTVPEGWTSAQATVWLDAMDALEGEIPEGVKEGELLPETYDYVKGQTRASLIGRMRGAMAGALAELWKARDPDLPFSTPDEALTLASIVEKETGRPEERRMVAAVFVNRLKKGMRLQSDPTTIYAVTRGQYVLDRPLSRKDLANPDPYNTYVAPGLPPGPICNPGRPSIDAVLHPADIDAVFFVSDGTGGHSFSDNLKDHNDNVKRLRAVERERRDASPPDGSAQ
ncbi:MAG: endolytic transglycosylase MltG [Rickettsiales bacterium]